LILIDKEQNFAYFDHAYSITQLLDNLMANRDAELLRRETMRLEKMRQKEEEDSVHPWMATTVAIGEELTASVANDSENTKKRRRNSQQQVMHLLAGI
jgi:hypothetical protein